MGLRQGQKADYAALEARRLEAGKLFARGYTQAEVSRKFLVRPASAHRWYQAWQQGGAEALKRKGRAGRRYRLSDSQLKLLEAELLAVAPAQGSGREWTLARIGKLIRKKFGISYHPGHVWKILRRIGWNAPQPTTKTKKAKTKPTRRA